MKYDTTGNTSNVAFRTTVLNFLDIGAAMTLLLVSSLGMVSLPAGSALRAVAVLPLVLFLPGYAVVTALYPRGDAAGTDRRSADERSLVAGPVGWPERGALAVGLSVAIVAVLMVGLSVVHIGPANSADWPPVVAVEILVFLGLMVGLVRRAQVPRNERAEVPYRRIVDEVSGAFSSSQPAFDRVLNLLLVVLVLSSVSGLAYAVASPPSAEDFTTMTVLTENESGEYVAGEYPSELTRGQEASLVVGVENHERTPAEYTVVPVVQRVERSGDSLTVLERQQLAAFEVAPNAGETAYETHSFAPEITGENLRVVYLLYQDAPPENPTVESSYRHVHVWMNVSSPA